jgi:O-antigen ligase
MTLLPHARHDGSNFASMKRPTLAVSAAILGGAIALRTLVAWAPVLRFDVDPVFDPAPFAGLGPAGSLYIDAVIALSAAFILAECASLWALTLLLVAGLASISIFQIHGVGAAGTPWRGATWIAGFVAAAAAVSLARSPQNTAKIAWSVLVTCLIAVAGAWWMRGAWQWCVEQPAVVEFFHSGARDVAFFAEHGWDADGPQAAAYVRRLSQREMSGWFGMANIFAGLFAAITVACVALGAWLPRRDQIIAFIVALLCAIIPLANGSKGAIVAMLLGLAFLVITRRVRVAPNTLAIGAVALILLCAFAAPLRTFLSEDALGQERSLLFRSQYITGAWRIFLHQPWTGSGIDGFQDAFLRFRPVDAVDAVQSAHSVFFDWLAQIGIAGIPMILAVFTLIFLAVKGSVGVATHQSHRATQWPQALATLAVVMAGTFAIRFEAHALDQASLAARLVGVVLASGFAWWLLPRIIVHSLAPSIIVAAAALTIWIDGQIEMTLWNPGSMIWGCVVLGVSVPRSMPTHRRWFDGGVQWFTAVAAILFSLTCFRFANIASQEETLVERAAQKLVDAAVLAKGEPGVQARMECAHVLLESTNGHSAFDSSKLAAIDQLLRASALATTTEQALGLLHEANSICQDMSQNTFQNRQIASLLSQAIAIQTRQDLDVKDAVDKALKVTELDSRCAGAWLRAARWAATLSQPIAGTYAKRAIESDDSMRFDALLKLRPSDRHEAEQLLASWPQK